MTAEARLLSPDELDAESLSRLTTTGQNETVGLMPENAVKASGRYTAGTLIGGKYQLAYVLGEGGMGSVWVARNRTLDVEVALKLMRSEFAGDVDGVAERMLQEARAAACIGHPAITQVYDFGFTEGGDPFIAMELLRGESLSATMRRRGRLRPIRAAQTLLPIVDALAATHQRGIVHRDLKPENIFLSRPVGQRLAPKVLDFGIAKLEQNAASRLTRDGAVIGSPAYMAPEQLRGEPDVDARADVWALAVVFYQMISGRRPFEADSHHATMWRVLNAEAPRLAEYGIIDPELQRIVSSGLAKDRKERCADMRSFGRSLAAWLLSQGVQEDVTDASLRSWVEPAATGPTPLNSFFPSEAPVPRLPVQETAPAGVLQAPLHPAASARSGTRRAVRVPLPGVVVGESGEAPPRAPELRRQWPIVTAAALAAFIAAAAWAAGDPAEVDAEPPPEADMLSASPRPRAALAPAARSASGVLAPLASTLVPAGVVERSAKDPVRRTGRPPGRKAAARTELKNPFDDP